MKAPILCEAFLPQTMIPDPSGTRPVPPGWVWYLAGALVYLSFGFTEMMGSDLWWHIAAGREIIQQGSVWLVDDWSYTAGGEAWHNHEWLADLLFYGWVTAFGKPSLVYWKWLIMVATFLLFQRLLWRLSGNAAAALVAAIAAIYIAAPFLDVRPQLYTLLGVAVLLNVALDRQPRLRELLLLFLLWVNLHGGFIFGLMLLPLLLFPWRDFSRERLRVAIAMSAACAAVCLVNPDGIRVISLPLVYALDVDSPYRRLAEWRSPFDGGGITSPFFRYSLVVGAALAMTWVLPAVRRVAPFSPAVLGFALLTAAMSVTSRRFIILWAMGFALLLAPFLGAVLRGRKMRHLALPLLAIIAAWGVWRLMPYPLQAPVADHYLNADYAYPHGLADFVELNDLSGRTFAYYNWGGYLHWRTDGALKVFIDGRANTLFDDQTYRDYVVVLGAQPGWIERVEGSDAQLFLWTHSRRGERLINGLLQTGRWTLLYRDVRGSILARKSFPLPPTLRLPRDSIDSDLLEASNALSSGRYNIALSAANRAHDRRPWDRRACRLLKRALQVNGRAAEGDLVMAECREWFPSRYLR